MNLRAVALVATAVAALAQRVGAADPSSIMGRWIETFPNGNGMVTAFDRSSISSYPVDKTGRLARPATTMPVTYKNLGGPIVAVVFAGGSSILIVRKGPDAITMDLPGVGAHALVKMPK